MPPGCRPFKARLFFHELMAQATHSLSFFLALSCSQTRHPRRRARGRPFTLEKSLFLSPYLSLKPVAQYKGHEEGRRRRKICRPQGHYKRASVIPMLLLLRALESGDLQTSYLHAISKHYSGKYSTCLDIDGSITGNGREH